ncbi:acyltransferase family protein [Flavitalea sp.]|nr:acyltransferase [Flavitalea sp.]
MKSKTDKVYFPNLNGLRAIGAFIVLIGHIEFIKQFWKIPYYQWFPIPGKVGVSLFFALSGFLITSLLLQEMKSTNTIKLKNFYIRRILRIWPLYYIIVVLSIFVFNQLGFLKIPGFSDNVLNNLSLTNILILLLLLPNFTHYYIPYADQRWSIIVEEQFYLFQPLLIRLLKRRNYLLIAFTVVIFSPEIIKFVVNILDFGNSISSNIVSALLTQLKYLACIAVGCAFSILFFRKENLCKRILFRKDVQWLVMIILFTAIGLGHYILFTEEVLDYRIYTLLCAVMVLNAAQNPASILKLENSILNFLGSISYGLYMYHPVCIGAGIFIATRITSNLIIQNILIYSLSVTLTILISWLSFKYVESFFLKIKSRMEIVKTKKKVVHAALAAPTPVN